jgi:hypothetical protein
MSRPMSKAIKVALILAIAAVAIAATKLPWSDTKRAADAAGAQVSPAELMRKSAPLPQTEVHDYY